MKAQSIDDMIRDAGWFKGTQRDWEALLLAERERIAFAATGCEVAYATWKAPVKCLHAGCRVKRGEALPITITKGVLAYEREAGWLRFCSEEQYRKIHDAIVRRARETGVYDPWEMPDGWQVMVYAGAMA